MNNFIFATIVALAASKSKVQFKDSQTNKERKNNLGDKKVVAGKAS
jgi:hypothetical protein